MNMNKAITDFIRTYVFYSMETPATKALKSLWKRAYKLGYNDGFNDAKLGNPADPNGELR